MMGGQPELEDIGRDEDPFDQDRIGNMEKTPSTGKTLEELIDRARRMALRHAETSSYGLNPDESVWQGIVRGIGRQAHTFGWPYCP